MKKIKKILIANRGEIAVRILHAAKELGIRTVAMYSEVDRSALHVIKSDEVFALNYNGVEPYLDIEQILNIASKAKVDAIHPGYGFLSENSVFAHKVEEKGFIFIGPSGNAMEMLGDKLRAKDVALKAGVPVVPGFEINDVDDPELIEKINSIGFPILIKARAGGGGKGMRLVNSPDQIQDQMAYAVREAKEAFGDGSVFIEKYIKNPRHIEIQILADSHGNTVHLFERECSIQRRHQKVIEEAPSSVLDDALREEMGNAAIRLAKACNYTNAGTLEFILGENKNYYFLEMNTRLQVEHPVTEFITGVDIVKQQIWIAEGKALSFSQSDLKIVGHAIELRVYAEDPQNSFLPDIGILKKYRTPKGIGVRVDDGYEEGMEVPMEYDPLISKLVAYGANRNESIMRMKRAIDEYEIVGVRNTLDFGRFVMNDKDFCDGNFDTGFILSKLDKFTHFQDNATESMMAAIVSFEFLNENTNVKIHNKPILRSKWRERLKK